MYLTGFDIISCLIRYSFSLVTLSTAAVMIMTFTITRGISVMITIMMLVKSFNDNHNNVISRSYQ